MTATTTTAPLPRIAMPLMSGAMTCRFFRQTFAKIPDLTYLPRIAAPNGRITP